MNVPRRGAKGATSASFGLASLMYVLTPTGIGYQDLASLLAQQPAVAERWRQHLIASPFGTIHAATFSMPRPIGTAIPDTPGYRLASLDPRGRDGDPASAAGGFRLASVDPRDPGIVGTLPSGRPGGRRDAVQPPLVFPSVDRSGKGDRLVVPRRRPSLEAEPAAPSDADTGPRVAEPADDNELQAEILAAIHTDGVRAAAVVSAHDEIEAAVRFEPFPQHDIALSLELDPQVAGEEPGEIADIDPAEIHAGTPPNLDGLNTAMEPARLFFGLNPMSAASGAIERWAPGEEPLLMPPQQTAVDPDIKQAALQPPRDAAPPKPDTPKDNVTVAGKGEVTGEGQRPKSPAERLGLVGKAREKAEKCLANAIYFESRGEAVRGQIAVAQVVMNRAFSGYYPGDVCGVVYQNAHRHLACQFTFACDGRSKAINEPDAMERAKRISRETLDGKLWLPEIGKSTHYHAYWVRPWWTRTMRTLTKIGVHTFYRPHKWGDGADAPSWGSAAYTADAAKKL